MLGALKKIFSAEQGSPDGKIPLAEVLRKKWLEVWYQPKIDLRTLRLTGAEALVRARHPKRGVLGPHMFLPGATEHDMLAMTERVILGALRDWEAGAANGMSLKLSVNVPVTALVKLPLAKMLKAERPRSTE